MPYATLRKAIEALQAFLAAVREEEEAIRQSVETAPGMRPPDAVISAVPADRKVSGSHGEQQDRNQQQYAGDACDDFEFNGYGIGKRRHNCTQLDSHDLASQPGQEPARTIAARTEFLCVLTYWTLSVLDAPQYTASRRVFRQQFEANCTSTRGGV